MSSVGKLRKATDAWLFWCPGCDEYHQVPDDGRWTFNGNYDMPTFTPSIVTHISEGKVCHIFIRDGRIEYLGDCHHSMANSIVDMENDD